MPDAEDLRTVISRVILSDPRGARNLLETAVDTDMDSTEGFLRNIYLPEYARLRSLVANVARNHHQKARFVPFLLEWRDAETDEFTRRAIYAALADVDERSYAKTIAEHRALPPQTVEIYQYVAERLRHRLRNAMLVGQAYAAQLQGALSNSSSAEMMSILAKLSDAMLTLGRVLESTEVDPQYFKEQPVIIVEWLKRMNGQYASKFTPIRLIVTAEADLPTIYGSDYLLETIFWNIWANAQQAIGEDCEISISISRRGAYIVLLIVDNGDGFPEELLGVAFSQQYSSNSTYRGRGLLEVSDAVARLRGSVDLFQHRPGEYRMKLLLPEYRS